MILESLFAFWILVQPVNIDETRRIPYPMGPYPDRQFCEETQKNIPTVQINHCRKTGCGWSGDPDEPPFDHYDILIPCKKIKRDYPKIRTTIK